MAKGSKERGESPQVTVHVVESWADFVALVGRNPFRHWAFRGQASAAWRLWPTLSRELHNREVHPELWTRQEQRSIRVFQRKATQFLEQRPEIDDTAHWLALMQHHGAPTRLLDFTWSPYVAAFFALESAVSDAAIWAIDAPRIGTFAFGPSFRETDRPLAPREMLAELGLENPSDVAVGEPYFKNRRLIAQSGTFACPVDITRPLDAILGAKPDLVAQIVLRGTDLRREGLEELYRMNITYATLFPDLDGLSRSIGYELEYHWEIDTRTGERRADAETP